MFKNVFTTIRFYSIVIMRAIKLAFKKKSVLNKVCVDYSTNIVSKNSFFIIDVKFQNILFYQINNTKYLHGGIKIIDVKNLNDNKIMIKVKGLKETFEKVIEFNPETSHDFKPFELTSNNIQLEIKKSFNDSIALLKNRLSIYNTSFYLPKIKIKNHNSQFNYSKYNQKDFI